MTRGHPPWVAIEEAMHHAERLGYLVSSVNSRTLPCNFMAIHDEQITLVRVRRLTVMGATVPPISWHPVTARSWNSGYIGPRAPGPGVRTGTGTDMPRRPDRICGDVRHGSIPTTRAADASGRVIRVDEEILPLFLFSKFRPNNQDTIFTSPCCSGQDTHSEEP